MRRRELVEIAIGAALVVVAALVHVLDAPPVAQFAVSGLAIAALARLVGASTEQLGGRLGSSATGAVQSALGNLPELFIALFALHHGLVRVVQAALIGSVLANSVLVLGLAFVAGGLRHGTQTFDTPRARILATLTMLAAATLSVPTFAHEFHSPAARHEHALSLICAGVLLGVFVLTLPGLVRGGPEGEEHEPSRWSFAQTVTVLGGAAGAAALVSDWFVGSLTPAIHVLHMSQDFAGLVVVAIAGNAVENVVGIQLARRNRLDFAISVIVSSSLQVALALTPILVFASFLFASELTLVFPVLLVISLLFAAVLGALVIVDGESTWEEGAILVGLYVVIAASFWWGA